MSVKELVVKMRADAAGYDQGTKRVIKDNEDVKKSSSGLGSGFTKGIGAALGFAATSLGISSVGSAVGLVGDFLGSTISAAKDAQNTMAQTNAVLKSTKDASGQSAQSISDFADAQMRLTGIDDQAIQGAENMIATFTNIKGNVFPGASKAVLDMATAMNGGAIPSAEQLRQTAIQVGKALNDPVQGVTALQRVGVKLSDTQLAQVKHFMALGDAASAQKVILGELTNEFGGSASAAGSTFAGKMAILQGNFQNIQETIGGAVLPVLTKLLTAIMPLVTQFGAALPGAIADVQKQVAPFVSKVGDLIGNLTKNKPLMDGLKNAFQSLKPLIGPVLIALGILTAISFAPLAILIGVILGIVLVLKKLWEITEPVRTALGNLFGAIGDGITKAQAAMRQGVEKILELLSHIPGPAGDMARGVLNSMKAADDATRAHTEAMKTQADIHTAQMAMKTIANLDKQRQGILKQLQETKDPAKKHMLEMKLQSITSAEEMQKEVVKKATAMAAQHSAQMKALHDKAAAEAKAAKDGVLGHIGAMKDQALAKVGAFIGQAVANFQAMPGRIGTALNTLKSLVSSKIDEVKNTFQNGLNAVKNFFTNLVLKLPHINLPHFSITGNLSINPPSVPHLDIKWYAGGGIFTAPSIIGVGEAGPEAVVPLSRMGGMGGGGGSERPLNITLEVDGRAFAQAMVRRYLMPEMVEQIRVSAGIRSN